jgi:hypothetical protein
MTITSAIGCKRCDRLLGISKVEVIQVKPEWIKMSQIFPLEEGEILFISKANLTEERIGIAIPDKNMVLLKRTEISFDDVVYWLSIPKSPLSAESQSSLLTQECIL